MILFVSTIKVVPTITASVIISQHHTYPMKWPDIFILPNIYLINRSRLRQYVFDLCSVTKNRSVNFDKTCWKCKTICQSDEVIFLL